MNKIDNLNVSDGFDITLTVSEDRRPAATSSSGVVKTLYHFTSLMHLPDVRREGITRGIVPIGPVEVARKVQAANLTTNGNREDQRRIWCGSRTCVDKTKIRLTVEILESELINYRQLRERFRIKSKWIKELAPIAERKHWFYAFDGVTPQQITSYEIWVENVYRRIESEELGTLIRDIEAERTRIGFKRVGPYMSATDYCSWLIDGPGIWLVGMK